MIRMPRARPKQNRCRTLSQWQRFLETRVVSLATLASLRASQPQRAASMTMVVDMMMRVVVVMRAGKVH
jgi:hypothetical protein